MEIINKAKLQETQRDIMARLAKRIKSEREKRGYDVIELVIRSGVSQATIYNLEAGVQCNIGLKSLTGLAIAFEIQASELIQ